MSEIAGWAYTADGTYHAFKWRDGTMEDLGTLGGSNSQAFGINNFGEVVGHSQIGADGSYYAFFYSNGVMINLNDLIPIGSGWTHLSAANAINDAGQIVGWGTINGESHAFLMTALPMNTEIDIIPGDESNTIDLRREKKISVAIHSSPNFSVPTMMDQGTLTFGATGNEASFVGCSRKAKDVNGDGQKDLVCQFSTKLTGFQCGDITGILRGKTATGRLFEGSQAIAIVPCR